MGMVFRKMVGSDSGDVFAPDINANIEARNSKSAGGGNDKNSYDQNNAGGLRKLI